MSRIVIIFFINIVTAVCGWAFSAPTDSIGIEKKAGKMYILHKVEAKETLFSIARKYKVAVGAIKDANPEAATGLNVGQVIRVLFVSKNPTENPIQGSGVGKMHTVEAKETLFSISRKYKVSVDALTAANPSIAAGLKVGQELSIPNNDQLKKSIVLKNEPQKVEPKVEKIEKVSEEKEVAKVEENLEEQEVEASVKKTKSALTPAPTSGYKKINESGQADLMPNTSENLKYLALHKSAPIGTIIQVRNDDNDQKIFVRVIGKITTPAEDKSILKLSPKAMERLGAKSEKITVSISYIP